MNRDEVLNTLYGSRFWKDIEIDFTNEAKKAKSLKQQSEFFSKWSIYLFFESEFPTIKNRSLTMRKSLVSAGIDENNSLISYFKIDKSLHQKSNEKYSKKIEIKLNERLNKTYDNETYNNETPLKIANMTIEKLIKNINKKDIGKNDVFDISNNSTRNRELAYQKLIVLAIATGRRQIELLKMLEIAKKKDLVTYKNLAKKKKSDISIVDAPILIDIDIAKKYLRDVREEFKTEKMDNKTINSKYNSSIRKSMFRYLDENLANKGFHFFRALYAKACFERFKNNIGDENFYFTKILGHKFKVNPAHPYQIK